MVRAVIGIVAGVLAAFALVFCTDALFRTISTVPLPASMDDAAAMGAYVAAHPAWLLVSMVVGWAIAAWAGAAIAVRIARRGAWPGWVVTGIFLAATLANFAMVPHPAWMMLAAVAAILVTGWTGSRFPARTGLAA